MTKPVLVNELIEDLKKLGNESKRKNLTMKMEYEGIYGSEEKLNRA